MSEFNIKYMEKALELAREAFQDDEVPVGAVIVRNGEIVATGRNNACKVLGGWRLWNCDIYVTLEPGPMCAGAIINAHIPNVYFGAYDFKNGSCGTITNLFEMPYNFKPNCKGGIMQEECAELLKSFFKRLR